MSPAAPLPPRLQARFDLLARRSPLLLAMDFDGTLALIAASPSGARMPAKVRRSLAALNRMPGLRLALLSGRSLRDLKSRVGLAHVQLAGNHGLSSNVKGLGLGPAQARRWRRLFRGAKARLAGLGLEGLGVELEDKGLGLALHLRNAGPGVKRGLPARLRKALRGLPLKLRPGLEILELLPRTRWDKGLALARLAGRSAPGLEKKGACLYAGDDATDEDAFKALRRLKGPSLSLKIGPGPSSAQARLSGPRPFWRLLDRVHQLRSKREV